MKWFVTTESKPCCNNRKVTESGDFFKFMQPSTQKMLVLSFVQVLRSYFLFSTVGFAFIILCDIGRLAWQSLDEVWCVL